jgi:cytochrome c-type biogenesis protein CcmH
MRTRILGVRTWWGPIALVVTAACADGRTGDAPVPPPSPAAADARLQSSALPPGHPTVTAPAGETLSGTVTLSPAVASAAREGRALFLIARAGKDRQIVAVKRIDDLAFPRAFELSSQDAMSHGTGFGGPLEITARLSRSGDAAPAAGDLEGVTAGVLPGATDVRIELRTVRR